MAFLNVQMCQGVARSRKLLLLLPSSRRMVNFDFWSSHLLPRHCELPLSHHWVRGAPRDCLLGDTEGHVTVAAPDISDKVVPMLMLIPQMNEQNAGLGLL